MKEGTIDIRGFKLWFVTAKVRKLAMGPVFSKILKTLTSSVHFM
jgi:hypothetical protein